MCQSKFVLAISESKFVLGKSKVVLAIFLLLLPPSSLSLENGLALTPPMGWLAWERFRCNTDCVNDPENCISERLFKSMADELVLGGWRAAGFDTIIMDDCWLAPHRAPDGQLLADPDRFPSGIPALANYVHKLQLKFGIYQDYGTKTCAGYPGSLNHLQTDARTFADWGVDYVKLDGCHSDPATMEAGYAEFGSALRATGRPIVFQCEWPLYQSHHGIQPNYTAVREVCNLWRNFYDVQDNWPSVQNIIDFYGDNSDGFLDLGGPGGWNDPDMLVIGNFGLSYDQSAAQMAIWSVLAAPLLISVDLRTIRPEFKQMLQHPGVLKVSQDPLGKPGFRVARRKHVDFFSRPVHPVYRGRTSHAVAIFNRWDSGGTPLRVTLSPAFLGLKSRGGYRVRDIFSGEDLGQFFPGDKLTIQVNPMGVRFLRFDILPSSPLDTDSIEGVEFETTEVGAGEGAEGEEGVGDAMQEEDEETEEAFCHVIEPGNAGRRLN